MGEKKKCKAIFDDVVGIALMVGMIYLLIWEISDVLVEFDILQKPIKWIWNSVASIILSAVVIKIFVGFQPQNFTKYQNWFFQNNSKVALGYVLLCIFLTTLRNDQLLNIEECKDIINLDWDILAISVTIFLAWEILVKGRIKDKKPAAPKDNSYINQIAFIDERRSYYAFIGNTYNVLVYLVLDVYVVIIASAFIFLKANASPLLIQNITIFSLFISTNTIISLFIEVIKPIKEIKRKEQKESIVTNEENRRENELIATVDEKIKLMNLVNNEEEFSLEEKYIILEKLLSEIGESIDIEEKSISKE